jgi:hypothetical protein
VTGTYTITQNCTWSGTYNGAFVSLSFTVGALVSPTLEQQFALDNFIVPEGKAINPLGQTGSSAGGGGTSTEPIPSGYVLTADGEGGTEWLHPAGGAPSGSAGGDLGGTFPDPSVAKINGTALGTLSGATTNQVLTWNGSAWVPQAAAGGAPTGSAGGDLSSTYPNPTVSKIAGTALGTLSGATSGQVLAWNGSAWAPAAAGGAPSGSASGDLSGSYPGPTVGKINGSPLGTTTGATTGYVLTWNGSAWVPQAAAGGAPTGSAGGDLSSTYPNPTVSKIAGTALGTLSGATTGYVLTWNGSAWAPAAAAGGAPSGSAGGDLSSTYPNPTVSKIAGTALGTLSGATTGFALTWNGSAWAPAATMPVFNVKTYGAVGNGVTDDTTAIQAAITAAEAATYGGKVYLPAGKYNIAGNLVITSPLIWFVGDGAALVTLSFSGTGICLSWHYSSLAAHGALHTELVVGGISGVTIDGTNAGTGAVVGFEVGDIIGLSMTDFHVSNFNVDGVARQSGVTGAATVTLTSGNATVPDTSAATTDVGKTVSIYSLTTTGTSLAVQQVLGTISSVSVGTSITLSAAPTFTGGPATVVLFYSFNSIGIHVNSRYAWCEETRWFGVNCYHNTSDIVFDRTYRTDTAITLPTANTYSGSTVSNVTAVSGATWTTGSALTGWLAGGGQFTVATTDGTATGTALMSYTSASGTTLSGVTYVSGSTSSYSVVNTAVLLGATFTDASASSGDVYKQIYAGTALLPGWIAAVSGTTVTMSSGVPSADGGSQTLQVGGQQSIAYTKMHDVEISSHDGANGLVFQNGVSMTNGEIHLSGNVNYASLLSRLVWVTGNSFVSAAEALIAVENDGGPGGVAFQVDSGSTLAYNGVTQANSFATDTINGTFNPTGYVNTPTLLWEGRGGSSSNGGRLAAPLLVATGPAPSNNIDYPNLTDVSGAAVLSPAYRVDTCTLTTGSAAVTDTSGLCIASDVGKTVVVVTAGSTNLTVGQVLGTVTTPLVPGTSFTLSAAPTFTGSGAGVTLAIQGAGVILRPNGAGNTSGQVLIGPNGSVPVVVGLLAARPAATGSGAQYFATDDAGGTLSIDTASGVWTTVAPRGLLGSSSITSSFTLTSTFGLVTGLAITVVLSTRPVRVNFTGFVEAPTNSDLIVLGIVDTTGPTTIQERTWEAAAAGTAADTRQGGDQWVEYNPGAGSRTFEIQGSSSAGTGVLLAGGLSGTATIEVVEI